MLSFGKFLSLKHLSTNERDRRCFIGDSFLSRLSFWYGYITKEMPTSCNWDSLTQRRFESYRYKSNFLPTKSLFHFYFILKFLHDLPSQPIHCHLLLLPFHHFPTSNHVLSIIHSMDCIENSSLTQELNPLQIILEIYQHLTFHGAREVVLVSRNIWPSPGELMRNNLRVK